MEQQSNVKRVLFLCTGNSARSQMAEGFLKKHSAGRFDVSSAGIAPAGVNPVAIAVMKEIGIDISDQTSDQITREDLKEADLLITLCGDARENCPYVPSQAEKRHWELEDPARAEGTDEQVKEKFREIRDKIKVYVEQLILE